MAANFAISKKHWDKIINYARARHDSEQDEIGGMAIIKLDKDDDDKKYIISDPVILKQETSGANCVLDKEALANYYVDMALKHGNNIQFLWWHSHANMGAFWSGTDTNTMKEYKSGKWSAFLVVNIKEEYKFRIQVWEPQEMYIDTDLEILGQSSRKIPQSIVKEVEEKCSTLNLRSNVYSYKNGYSNGVNKDQKTLWEEKFELDDWNQSFGIEDLELTKDNSHTWAIDAVDGVNDEYMEGTLPYNEYSKKVNKFNKKLKAVKSDVRIKLIGEGMLFHNIQHMYPYQFLKSKHGENIWQLS
jgi:proteasome lid subunit RPN8/RPN11